MKINNDLVNEEIRMRFNNVYDIENAVLLEDPDLNNNNEESNRTGHQNQKKFNINFNNAVFNKNFLHQSSNDETQIKHNRLVESDITVNFGNLNLNEAVLTTADLSLLPQIDDKMMLSVLMNKFESRKYYVSRVFDP